VCEPSATPVPFHVVVYGEEATAEPMFLFDHVVGARGRNCDEWCETLVLIFALIQKDRLAAVSPKSDQVF